MKKYLIFILSVLFILSICSCKKENTKETVIEYKEPTEEEIVEFCKQYYRESSKVHAESLIIYNIDKLDDYYINHEVDVLPGKSYTDVVCIESDKLIFNEIELYDERNYSIDGNNERIKFYFVKFTKKFIGNSNEIFSKPTEIRFSYEVFTYKNKIKIYGDPALDRIWVRESDLPIALQSLADGKRIQIR